MKPDDPEPEHRPSDDDSNDNENNASHANGNSSGSDEPPFHPIEPSNLGLPHDPNMGLVPTQAELRAAAERALDNISALFLLHQDDEHVIAAQLEEIASILLAASQLKGPHQAKAVKLGLQLNYRFWQTHHQENAWVQLIIPLLNTAIELGDNQLQAEAYRAWGIYLYTSGKEANQPRSAKALQFALEYAAESGYDDLKLLARIEQFNQQIGKQSEQDTLAEAQDLLTEARRLQDIYFEGRVYLSLARFYHRILDYYQIFHYAQQAMVIFWTINDYGLFCQSITYLIGSLQGQEVPHLDYRQRLLTTMEQMAEHITYPYISAALYYLWAFHYYQLKLYDNARITLLKSWRSMRAREIAVTLHMMGLIKMRRHHWLLARLFLEVAIQQYQKSGADQVQIAHVKHALAFIPFEQKDFATAYVELCKVLEIVEALPPTDARNRLLKTVKDDANRAKEALAVSNTAQ